MDVSYSKIRVVIPYREDRVDRVAVANTCDDIFHLKGTSFPTPILILGVGVQVTFMATEKGAAVLKLRSVGQKPEILSSETYPVTAVRRKCPNCGWIISNPECLRCSVKE